MATEERLTVAPIVGPDDPRRFTDSGIEVKPLYTEDDLAGGPASWASRARSRTRAARIARCTASSRGRCASTRATRRPRSPTSATSYLLAHGSTGLSMAFDLPTQLGLDSDDPRCLGEVGPHGRGHRHDRRHAHGVRRDPARRGLDVDDDQRAGRGAAAALRAGRRGAGRRARAAARHDAERRAQGVHRARQLHLPAGADDAPDDRPVRLLPRRTCPKWNTCSISGYHFREKGCSAVQEVAFTLCSGIAYVQAAIDAGLAVDDFAPRLAFFFNGHNNVFQEVAKFRAARRMWAHDHARALRRAPTSARCAALPHADRRRDADRPAAARTTSCASRCRASPRCAAARSRCTPTASTRRSRCPPSARPRSRCARSRSSPTSRAPPTPSTRSPAPTTSRR